MSPELETYFTNYNELFNHEGFKQLLHELTTNATQLADIQNVKNKEDLFFRKGQVAAFATVLNLQATVETAREQAEEEESEE
tara:strand:+ start:609 stop:854 length:246 start_codon:yes stop_codon:yes gene_type:complete